MEQELVATEEVQLYNIHFREIFLHNYVYFEKSLLDCMQHQNEILEYYTENIAQNMIAKNSQYELKYLKYDI